MPFRRYVVSKLKQWPASPVALKKLHKRCLKGS